MGVYLFTWYAPAHLGWSNGATLVDPNAPEPLLGWYNSSDPAVLEQQIAEIEETGFDYIALHVVSWSPESWRNAGQVFRLLEGRDLHAAIVLDSLYDATAAEKAWWSGYAAEAFGAHPNYFRQDGEPLVMLYAAPIDFSLPGAAMRNVYWTRNYGQSVTRSTPTDCCALGTGPSGRSRRSRLSTAWSQCSPATVMITWNGPSS